MSAHTPGPWSVDKGGAIRGAKVYKYARGNNTRQLALACLHDDLGPDEREANARLIAAAPALLEACEAALEIMDPRGPREQLVIAAVLRSAIAAARGGAK